MKNSIIALCLFALCLTACTDSQNEIASPLNQEVNLDFSIKSLYRGSLLEQLYAENLKSDSSLKSLDKQILTFLNEQSEVIQNFETYNNYSDNYYQTALSYSESIKDSLLKKQISNQLISSKGNYTSSIQQKLLAIQKFNQNKNQIRELYLAFKIIRTLSLIEEYQKTNNLDITSLDNVIENQLKFIQKLNLEIK